MKRITLFIFALLLTVFAFGNSAYADFNVQGFSYPSGYSQDSTQTGNATSVQNTTNQINTSYDCHCNTTPEPTQPAVTPTGIPGNPGMGGGESGGGSSSVSSAGSAVAPAIAGLSNTAGDNTLAKELLLLTLGGSSVLAGLKLIKDNASKTK